ncbi:hypothetical protein PCE1_004757 [Barthelona sp. PCE]
MDSTTRAVLLASLILADEGLPIEGNLIKDILDAAGIEYAPYLPEIYAKALSNVNIEDLIKASTQGGAAVPVTVAGGEEAAAVVEEESEPEPESESEEEDFGFDLFG